MQSILSQLFFKSKTGLITTQFIARINEAFRYRRSLYERDLAKQKLEKYFSSLTVVNGIMKGLNYPSFASFGSSLFPKLAGSYENELEDLLRKMSVNNYNVIIDIGCAEGYYAVGLAKLFSNSKVIAFDIDETARMMCGKMAEINGVKDNVTILERCTKEWLRDIKISEKVLIICDCEGYERHLFDINNIGSLVNTDLIIELHPMAEKDVKEYLHNLFLTSHDISYISSKDNNRKTFDLEGQYSAFSDLEKLMLVEEGRPFCMDWLILTAKGGLQ